SLDVVPRVALSLVWVVPEEPGLRIDRLREDVVLHVVDLRHAAALHREAVLLAVATAIHDASNVSIANGAVNERALAAIAAHVARTRDGRIAHRVGLRN